MPCTDPLTLYRSEALFRLASPRLASLQGELLEEGKDRAQGYTFVLSEVT